MLPTQPIPLPLQRQIVPQQASTGLQQVLNQQAQQIQQQQQQHIDQQALQQQVLLVLRFLYT